MNGPLPNYKTLTKNAIWITNVDKLKDAIRFIAISPEILSALLVFSVAYFWPEAIEFFAKFVSVAEASTASVIIGAPLAMVIGGYRLGFNLLNPSEQKRTLKQWPGYWMIRNRVIFSLVVGTTGLIGTVVAYFLANNGLKFQGTLVIAICWAVAATSVATVAYARMSLHDALNAKS
jgi:hypothetical protein